MDTKCGGREASNSRLKTPWNNRVPMARKRSYFYRVSKVRGSGNLADDGIIFLCYSCIKAVLNLVSMSTREYYINLVHVAVPYPWI